MSSSWNSVGLEVLYQVLGWVAFFAWSFSFYPQVLLNYKRKRSAPHPASASAPHSIYRARVSIKGPLAFGGFCIHPCLITR